MDAEIFVIAQNQASIWICLNAHAVERHCWRSVHNQVCRVIIAEAGHRSWISEEVKSVVTGAGGYTSVMRHRESAFHYRPSRDLAAEFETVMYEAFRIRSGHL